MEEAALKTSCRGTNQCSAALLSSGIGNDDVFLMERCGSVMVEEFFADDLLDLAWLPDVDKEEEDEHNSQGLPEPGKPLHSHTNSDCSALSFEPRHPSDLALPSADVAELEWVSHFVDESFTNFPPPGSGIGGVSLTLPPKVPKPHAARANQRVTENEFLRLVPVPVKAKRSKRARASSWVRSTISDASSCSSSSSSSSSSSISTMLALASITLPRPASPVEQKKMKKRGRKPKSSKQTQNFSATLGGGGERRCSHCGVQKTPQWRAGPEGAKTLCNACGVRFKSGRLLPEYRPACSPTFSVVEHSNSHRKVLEMRRKKAEEEGAAATAATVTQQQQLPLASTAPPVHSF